MTRLCNQGKLYLYKKGKIENKIRKKSTENVLTVTLVSCRVAVSVFFFCSFYQKKVYFLFEFKAVYYI